MSLSDLLRLKFLNNLQIKTHIPFDIAGRNVGKNINPF